MDLTKEKVATNDSLKADEIEALSAIFDKEWVLEDSSENVYSIKVVNTAGNSVYLQVIFTSGYPLESPPVYRISAPWMSRDTKNSLCSELEDIYLQNTGQSIIYMWIVKIQEFIEGPAISQDAEYSKESSLQLEVEHHLTAEMLNNLEKLNVENAELDIDELPPIQHGEPVVDRRSVFQAHIAEVVSVKQVKQVLLKLKENRKIATATHNVYAYRIALPNKAFMQDCEDDGETRAGSVLLHLMQILDVNNVLVVVSRWYGGINLGPDRFKHISNAARSILANSGLVTHKSKSGTSKNKKS